jgi:hypothetical protein
MASWPENPTRSRASWPRESSPTTADGSGCRSASRRLRRVPYRSSREVGRVAMIPRVCRFREPGPVRTSNIRPVPPGLTPRGVSSVSQGPPGRIDAAAFRPRRAGAGHRGRPATGIGHFFPPRRPGLRGLECGRRRRSPQTARGGTGRCGCCPRSCGRPSRKAVSPSRRPNPTTPRSESRGRTTPVGGSAAPSGIPRWDSTAGDESEPRTRQGSTGWGRLVVIVCSAIREMECDGPDIPKTPTVDPADL